MGLRSSLIRLRLALLAAALSLVWVHPAQAQNGPDLDPDAAQGYVNSVFHHAETESINLYNGQLTIPIAIGPSYSIGPKLKFQATLAYTSRAWEYGQNSDLPPQDGSCGFLSWPYPFQPLFGDPALGIGWNFALGAIKPCGVGQANRCYVSPDGAEHLFDQPNQPVNPSSFKTKDGGQLVLRYINGVNESSGYEMWDGDGNHYVFAWPVTGFEDSSSVYIHDFGRGRNGWYLTSLTDPFGNGLTVSYYAASQASPCPSRQTYCPNTTCSPDTSIRCGGTGPNSWVPHFIQLPGATISIGLDPGSIGPESAQMISTFNFPVLANGLSTTATWKLEYRNVLSGFGHVYGSNYCWVSVVELASIDLPNTLPGSPKYLFEYGYVGGPGLALGGTILTKMTLPTGASFQYDYGEYNFYHGRVAALNPGCLPGGPPADADVIKSIPPAGGMTPARHSPALPIDPCLAAGLPDYQDTQSGVLRKTATIPTPSGGTITAATNITQYAFPFGEQGAPGAGNDKAQTLTVIVDPPDVDGRVRAKSVLFWGGPKSGSFQHCPGYAPLSPCPGDRTGAELREAVYDHDPVTAGSIAMPSCGGQYDTQFCPNHAVRVTQRTFEYDDALTQFGNRRLQLELTYHQATASGGSCAGCKYHEVDFFPRETDLPGAWEAAGRHYTTEAHSGNLGNDSRTITTTWTPSNWMNPTGGTVLPNLYNQRRESDSTLTVNKYFEFNSSNGFLDCTFAHDPGPGRVWFDRRYVAGDGTLSQDFMGAPLGFPSPPYIGQCVATFPASSPPYPNGPPVGIDGNSFGKLYTYQHGLLTSVRWINGNSPAGWYAKRLTRDVSTGWITASYDTAGLTTGYLYDGIGRVTSISPPGEATTTVTYPSTTQTLASRNGGPGLSLSQEYDYDGLGRLVRERRSMPGNQTAKQFSLFDPRGSPYFKSEWLPDAASESLSRDLATTCPSSSGSYSTLRPSAAAGTYQLCYDPLGRPQMTVGANHSSLITADWTDGSVFYSDTRESVTTGCINGTYSGGLCSFGSDSTTTAFHDAFGRVTSVVEPADGTTATYGYDVNGKLTSVSQGVQSRSFVYDPFGFLRQETTPEAGTVSYDYGSLGNVLTETLPDSVIVTHGYDYAARLKSLTTSEGGGRTYLQNTYQETQGSDASLGKLVSRVATNYAVSPAPTVTDGFTYGGVGGRLSAQTTSISGVYGLSVTQKWRYNFLGLLSDHYHPRQASELPFVVSSAYDAGLPVTEYLNGIPTVTGLTYRSTGALATYAAGLGIGHDVTTTIDQDGPIARPSRIYTTGAAGNFDTGAYAYDGAGNISQMGSDSFTYGLLSRLSGANFPGVGSQTFLYDIYGNMRAKNTFDPGGVIIPGESRTYDMIAASNHISTEAYDPRGNVTAGGTYTYDGLDRLVTDSSSGSTWRYLFSGDNERVVRIPPPGLGNPAYTLRDEKKRVITEYVGSTASRDNVFFGNLLVASYANTLVGGSLDAWHFHSSDHLGTPRLDVGLAGNVIDSRKYWPYGEWVGVPLTNQRLRFAGMENDTEAANRYYDHARSHDAGLGRFLSPDLHPGQPMTPQSWNRYSYVRGNPIRLTDSTGLDPDDEKWPPRKNDKSDLTEKGREGTRDKVVGEVKKEVVGAAKKEVAKRTDEGVKTADKKLKDMQDSNSPLPGRGQANRVEFGKLPTLDPGQFPLLLRPAVNWYNDKIADRFNTPAQYGDDVGEFAGDAAQVGAERCGGKALWDKVREANEIQRQADTNQ